MSEVKRYFWNADNLDGFGYGSMDSLADASSQELVCASDYDSALSREAALREELESLGHWRNLALQFDNHRMSAMAHLKALVADSSHAENARKFLAEPPIPAHELQQRLTDAEKKLGEAYEWGYSDGQNCPNGYSDEKDREKCVAELNKPAAESEALGTRPTGCCCPPKGHTGIWAAAMCPVHFGLRRPKPSAEGEGS